MNNTVVLMALCILCASLGVDATPNEAFDKQLENCPKNMARHHIGTNLFVLDSTKMSYEPTEAAAAWLDDDVSTGWAPPVGKNYYLLALPAPDLLTHFMISAKASGGKINLYAGDELALPDSGSWSPIVRDLDISEINGKKMSNPFSRFAKYLLIEVDITEAGQWYSLYAYGERPAIEYSFEKRDNEIDSTAIFGSYCNEQTAISLSSLYTGARVVEANTMTDPVSWQNAIDDNPASSVSIASSSKKPGMVLEYESPISIHRVSLLTNSDEKGRFDFYLLETLDRGTPVTWNTESEYLQVANSTPGPVSLAEIDLTGLKPTATVVLDGTSSRSSVDFPSARAGYLLVQWTPADGTHPAEVSELNSFSSSSLNTYEVKEDGPAVGELTENKSVSSKDGKTFKDFKEGKEILPPAVGELLPSKIPLVPSALGAPVILTEVPTSP